MRNLTKLYHSFLNHDQIDLMSHQQLLDALDEIRTQPHDESSMKIVEYIESRLKDGE